MKSYLILNFKTYAEASGPQALQLAGIASEFAGGDVEIVVCPQAVDIREVADKFPELTVWAQHVDVEEPGKHTGHIAAEAVAEAGGTGSLLNHSEHPLDLEQIERGISNCQEYQMTACVCVGGLEQAAQIVQLNPQLIAFEPPTLIGGPESLLDTNAAEAGEFLEILKNSHSKAILGAGVRDAQDVNQALQMGFSGVLLSSGFVLAESPAEFLRQTLSGFVN